MSALLYALLFGALGFGAGKLWADWPRIRAALRKEKIPPRR